MAEQWRDIPDYEGRYQVSDRGRVRSLPRLVERENWTPMQLSGRVLRPRLSHKGYLLVGLTKGSKTKNFSVHRLVASVFIENHGNKPEINHINGDKTDNRVANLDWVTSKENTRHSIQVLGNRRDLPKYAVRCLDTGRVYPSVRKAAEETGCRRSGISAVCRGEKNKHHGLHWAYVKEVVGNG